MKTIDAAAAQETSLPELPPHTIELDEPLKRGDQLITHITLRKPDSGALRGTSLVALGNLDVDALLKVLPRVSTPTLTDAELRKLDPADLMQLAGEFATFLAPKARVAEFLANLASQTE